MADEATTTSTESTEATSAPETPTVQFDGPFDEERAKRKIAAMEEDKAKLRERLAAYEKAEQEKRDAEKSELEKLTERLQRAEATLAERDKADARAKAVDAAREKHGLSKEDMEILAGVPDEELDARASALAKRLASSTEAAAEVPGKPKAKLTPGHQTVADDGATADPTAIADRIYKSIR